MWFIETGVWGETPTKAVTRWGEAPAKSKENSKTMELSYSKEEEEFRKEVGDWIKASRPEQKDLAPGKDNWAHWRKKLLDKGWLTSTWPTEYGGADFSIMQQVIFNEECAMAGVPRAQGRSDEMGIYMVGPTLIAHGSKEQIEEHLPKILNREREWCQGFSEPNAGSDLAGLQSKAIEDGDDFLITGQKIWTTEARMDKWCFFMARTDQEASKHKGISYFLIPMSTPGIEIRPIKQITGGSEFFEMFFDKVRVPKSNVVGGLNNGWKVAMSTLAHERSGLSSAVSHKRTLEGLKNLAKRMGKNKKKVTRNELVQLYFDVHALLYTGYRNLSAQLKGEVPGPEAYVGKVFGGELVQRFSAMGVSLQGPYGLLWQASPESIDWGTWQMQWVGYRAATIAGGTSEINRNLVAERALGLPSWKTPARMAAAGKDVG